MVWLSYSGQYISGATGASVEATGYPLLDGDSVAVSAVDTSCDESVSLASAADTDNVSDANTTGEVLSLVETLSLRTVESDGMSDTVLYTVTLLV